MDKSTEIVSWPPKIVIYATDFSASAQHAGRYAQFLAQQFHADLLVAHAFTLSQAAMELEAETSPHLESAQRKELQSELAKEAQRFGEGARDVKSILMEGNPVEWIPALARASAPSVIVLGTRGRDRLERGIVGSTADGILRSANLPSVTVGPLAPELAPGTTKIRNILFASDLSPAAVHGAAYAVKVAQTFGANLDALHVVDEGQLKNPEKLNRIHQKFHAGLASVAPKCADHLVEPREWIEAGAAHTRILEHAAEHKADLLVLAVHTSSHLWLRQRLSGAFYIVGHATCPVMTITG